MQLVLSNNRVLAHGENFIAMGGTVINTETNRVYQNATIAECSSCPSDIDTVGYKYHAGVFVPCAPYGKGNGNIMVACQEDCGVPKDSGRALDEVFAISSYLTFVGQVNSEQVDAALGKNNEELITGVGVALAMYGWYKGTNKKGYPFTELRTMSTLNNINLGVYNELIQDEEICNLLVSSNYASDKVFSTFSDSLETSGDSYETYTSTKQITITETDLTAPFRLSFSLECDGASNNGSININGVVAASCSGGRNASGFVLRKWSDYNITSAGTYDVLLTGKDYKNANHFEGSYTIYKAKEY